MPLLDKLLLRKRGILETINDQLKNISQIEHSRHRSVYNFFVTLLGGLIAYTFREKKPLLHYARSTYYRQLYHACVEVVHRARMQQSTEARR